MNAPLAQSGFPVGDWQFWVATVVVALILGVVAWKVLPIAALRRRRRASAGRTKATLTVRGKPVSK